MGKHANIEVEKGMRFCRRCLAIKPETTEYFGKATFEKGGLTLYCNECIIEYRKDRYDKGREAIVARQKGYNKRELLVVVHRKRLKPGTVDTLTTAEWIESIDFFNGLDAYTGRPMIRLAMDHVIPLSKGGGHEKCNVIPCDGPINLWKHDYNMEEWYRKEIFFDEDRLIKIKEWTNGGN